MRTGSALVLSAPSGSGKSTLSQMLLDEFANLGYSISCTTRAPREGEIDGVHYHFLTEKEFLAKRDAGAFAEWARVHDNYYGTPLEPVRKMLAEGRDILFDIDVQGAMQLKKSLPRASFAFILPPSMRELQNRLLLRGLDSEETIKRRMNNAQNEIRQIGSYDALIINDVLEKAYKDLRAFYIASTLAPDCHKNFLDTFLGS